MRPFFALSILVLLLAFGPAATAFTGLTTENFATANYKDATNTTAVWNLVTNTVHPPLTVCYSVAAPCNSNAEDLDVDIGTGSDGPFDVPYYSNFGTITGSSGNYTITINTNTHPVFNFTYFNLAAGYTITGVGSNPLWFKVQGSFISSGVINCSGGNGADVSANTSNVAAGGTAVCGGGAGGIGGSLSSLNGGNGANSGSPVNTGGTGGTGSSASAQTPYGGGGGGSFGGGSTQSGGGSVVGGTAPGGAFTSDPYCGNLGSVGDGPGGGSGGGGGGAYLFADGFQASGAGGGGGGGVVHIAVGGNFTQNATGQILATGGNGGNSNGAVDGGPGGGGGGGTIVVHSGGNVVDNGTMIATQGNRGTQSHGATPSTAGNGDIGRGWVAQLGTMTNGAGENPTIFAGIIGVVHYKTEAFVLQTLGYDSLNTSPIFTLFNQTASLPNASTATLQIAGSNDNFVHDDTGFVTFTNVSALSGKRFFRIKDTIQLVTGGVAATTPAAVSNVTATYGGFQSSSFQFGSACGTFGSPGEFFFDLFLCLSIGLISTGRLGRRKLFRRSKTNPAS